VDPVNPQPLPPSPSGGADVTITGNDSATDLAFQQHNTPTDAAATGLDPATDAAAKPLDPGTDGGIHPASYDIDGLDSEADKWRDSLTDTMPALDATDKQHDSATDEWHKPAIDGYHRAGFAGDASVRKVGCVVAVGLLLLVLVTIGGGLLVTGQGPFSCRAAGHHVALTEQRVSSWLGCGKTSTPPVVGSAPTATDAPAATVQPTTALQPTATSRPQPTATSQPTATPLPPSLAVSTTTLSAYCYNGPWSASFQVQNKGGGALSWGDSSTSWPPDANLKHSPDSGSLGTQSSDTVTISEPSNASFKGGFTIIVSSNGGKASINFTCL
jgi:hypothetical protein